MITKKIFSGLLTVALAAGIAFAIYDSAARQKAVEQTEAIHKQTEIEELRKQKEHLLKQAESDARKLAEFKAKNKRSARQPNVVASNSAYSAYSGISLESPFQVATNNVPHIDDLLKNKLSKEATLHVIGVYQGEPEEGQEQPPWWSHCIQFKDDPTAMMECQKKYTGVKPRHKLKVKITYTKSPIVLALMAYTRVLWDIDIYPGVQIEGVIIGGYHSQKILGVPTNIPIIAYTHDTSEDDNFIRGEGYFFAYKDGSGLSEAARKLKQITGKDISSFQGKYKSKTFVINNTLD
jgi:hypothetical protein